MPVPMLTANHLFDFVLVEVDIIIFHIGDACIVVYKCK